jgi:16S rRNA (cytidine1402-2'-O)-methyltransferase
VGFLPRKAGERAARLAALAGRAETLVFFESPRRVAATLRELARVFGARRACVARELTKLHEENSRGSLTELAERFAAGARGEVTLVVEGAPPAAAPGADAVRERVRALLAGGASARDIAARLARETGTPRRALYALALEEQGR